MEELRKAQEKVSGLEAAEAKLKTAGEALKRERDKAQKYLDIAGVIFIAVDADHKITLINKKGCEILGYEEDEIIGKNWFGTFLPKNKRDEIEEVFKKLISGEIEPIEYFENHIRTRSGEERLIAWHNTIVKDDMGKIVGTLSSGMDITDKRKLEEELLRTSKLESVGILAGGIAHEYNNILTAVLGSLSIAQRKVHPEDGVADTLKMAEEATIRAKDLTQQ